MMPSAALLGCLQCLCSAGTVPAGPILSAKHCLAMVGRRNPPAGLRRSRVGVAARSSGWLVVRAALVLALLAAMSSACGGDASNQQLTSNEVDDFALRWSPDGTRIFFIRSSDRDEGPDGALFVMNADGSNVTQMLDSDDVSVLWWGWSPDGTRVLAGGDRGGDEEIFVVDADRGGAVQLTDNDAHDWALGWSPDGARIAFTSDRDGDQEIFVMNADGTGVAQLTHNDVDDSGNNAWSPDGARILFNSYHDGGDSELFIMNADGTGVTRLAGIDDTVKSWRWSPDGALLLFISYRLGGVEHDGWEMFVMDTDSGDITQLTDDNGFIREMFWSPAGSRIFYTSGSVLTPDGGRVGDNEIFVMDADGTGVVQLTDNETEDRAVGWSPDGARVAFTSARDGDDRRLFLMNADGSDVIQVTDHDVWGRGAEWSPDGTRVLYTNYWADDDDTEIFVFHVNALAPSQPAD